MTKKNYRIALIPGDGIGHEVVPAAAAVLEKVGSRFGFSFEWAEFDWSCERYTKTGLMMPDDGVDQLRAFDGIFLGAVGYPGVEDHISLWGLLIPIRRAFDQYANVRPLKLFEGVKSPLAGRGAGDIDMVIVRENAEGEYSEMGGRIYAGTEREVVIQESVFSRFGVDRIIRHAFELATRRAAERGKTGHVTSATKSNGIIHTMPFWDERFEVIAAEYPNIETDKFHIDILTAHFVQHPDWFDVVVGSNLFGDILSDLGAAVVGGMGLAPAANLNPESAHPSMFEPVHGSAPDIAGKGIANPVAQIWTGAMMLDHLGEGKAARAIEAAIATVLADGSVRTPDLGGQANTATLAQTIADVL
ncbi:MAG: tartrate dehydrogenase [Alphaproteobacteria bacterium]|nr:tartrate dehydrogenase [Alphaproteobacteria bacterium]